MTRSALRFPFALALVLAQGCGLFDEEDDTPPPPPIAAAPAPPQTVALGPPPPTPPYGAVPMTVLSARRSYLQQGYTLVLADPTRTRSLPIYVGEMDGVVIEQRLAGQRPLRPMTQDLLDELVRTLGGRVLMTEIHAIEGDVFAGAVHVWDGQRTHRLDARSSDAVAIALGHHAPIYVAQAVLDQASVPSAYY